MARSGRAERARRRGFSMIEVAIAIAVIAILAGAAAPLVMKALNQQREQKTRENLEVAWKSLMGSRDRRVPNMVADFGWTPAAALNLGPMVRYLALAPPRPPNPPAAVVVNFPWGWNGPYWNGPTVPLAGNPVPADAWGNPIQMRLVGGPTPGFQLISTGPNRAINSAPNNPLGLVDDVVYPPIPVPLASMNARLIVNVTTTRSPAGFTTATVTIRTRNGSNLPLNLQTNFPIPAPGLTATQQTTQVPVATSLPGPMQIDVVWTYTSIVPPLPPTMTTTSSIVDLLPGEFKTADFRSN